MVTSSLVHPFTLLVSIPLAFVGAIVALFHDRLQAGDHLVLSNVCYAGVAEYARHGNTGVREYGRIGFSVVRGGDIVGEHQVMLIGERERVTLGHAAQDRALFAEGALRAARWIAGKAPGTYTMRTAVETDHAGMVTTRFAFRMDADTCPVDDPAPAAQYGNCDVLDPAYMDFDPTTPILTLHTTSDGRNVFFTDADRPGVIEYHTGSVGDPNTFNCGTGTWSATLRVRARWRFTRSRWRRCDARSSRATGSAMLPGRSRSSMR